MSEPLHKQAQSVVSHWNQSAADARVRDAQFQHNHTPVTPDGKFGMDGYTTCGAIVGGIYGGMAGGWLGGIAGAVVGAVFVLITLGPFWFLYKKYRGWNDEGWESKDAEAQPASAPRPRLSKPMSFAVWTIAGLALGAWAGMGFAEFIDSPEDLALAASLFGAAGAAMGFVMRLITLPFRKTA